MKADSRRTVLVVDDDPDARNIVSSVIQLLDYEAIEAGDGELGLALFNQTQPDLVVLDVMMPKRDGNEVCREIRKTEAGRLTPIIMLTAKDSLQDKVSSLEGGADDYLTKPFHYDELKARLHALMRVRELNLNLRDKNLELAEAQAKLVAAERQLAVEELAGGAAHALGQPLSAIILNCHLLEKLPAADPKCRQALAAIRQDAERMHQLLETMKSADAGKTETYHDRRRIVTLKD